MNKLGLELWKIPAIITLLQVMMVISPSTAKDQFAANNVPHGLENAEYYIQERMLVKPGKEDWFIDYFRTKVVPVLAMTEGYMGTVFSTTIPKNAEDFGPVLPLGPPEKPFLPHLGIKLNGTQTDTQINFDSMLRGTYNFQVYHYFRDEKSLQSLLPEFGPNWKKRYGEDSDPWDTLATEYFSNLENHWDTVYRIVK